MDNTLKSRILSSYLSQQAVMTDEPTTELQAVNVPSPGELEEFRNQVRAWVDMDNTIKKLQQAVKERNQLKKQMGQKIIAFMARYNIEDLNTNDGKLSYRIKRTKAPISQSEIKTKLLQNFSTDTTAQELVQKVFEERGVIEKPSLRRIGR